MIKAEIVADSLSPQGDRLTSLLITFPRIILAEVNTHRMLSKNTSSSRAIPFNKMVEAIKTNPFIPIAWQKEHKGMQGNEYWTNEMFDGGHSEPTLYTEAHKATWLQARDMAIEQAGFLNKDGGVTKQLCNRLLEPFMWTTMLITGSKEGWDNFFDLRCPNYTWIGNTKDNGFKSRKEMCKSWKDNNLTGLPRQDLTLEWLKLNEGQAEIHMMALAECIYDAMNESIPEQLKEEQWHIPFENKMQLAYTDYDSNGIITNEGINKKVKLSTAMAARTSYTMVGDEKEINYERMIDLHDRLISQNPPHSSPMEHCAVAMSDDEYYSDFGAFDKKYKESGWCRNYKGFIQYRHLIETQH